jgi:hypothetical protein
MHAWVAEWRDAALQRVFERPHSGGWGAAGEGRRRGGEGQCEHGAETYAAAKAFIGYNVPYPTLRSCEVGPDPPPLSIGQAWEDGRRPCGVGRLLGHSSVD